MTLHEQIKNDMKEAMKAKESNKVVVLRGLMSACTNELVAQKKTPQDILDDAGVLAVITREAKRRKDSITQFTDGGRPDLAIDEQAELDILNAYLPKMMPREEVYAYVQAKIAELGITDKSQVGQLMGALMKELQGKADGLLVKEIVAELLG